MGPILKTCSDCGRKKELTTCFHRSGYHRSGAQRYQSQCKPCRRVYVRDRLCFREGPEGEEHQKETQILRRASQNRLAVNPERVEVAYAET